MDSFDACTSELISFLKGIKKLAPAPVMADAASLERPALMLLFVLYEHGPIRPSALAESLHIDLSTVSRQLGTLESSGWVTRDRDADDRRAFLVRLSAEGTRVLQANLAARKALLSELLIDWSEDERQEFARLLGRLNKTLERRSRTAPQSGAC